MSENIKVKSLISLCINKNVAPVSLLSFFAHGEGDYFFLRPGEGDY